MREWRKALIERLKQNSEEATHYLSVALEEYQKDQDMDALLIALTTFVEARGGKLSS